MSRLPEPGPIDEASGMPDAAGFAALRQANRPLVLRGAFAHWPAVAAGRVGAQAIVDYLNAFANGALVPAIAALPAEKGRFFYNADLSGMNFVSGRGPLPLFLADLLRTADDAAPPAMAVQSAIIADVLPGFVQANRCALLGEVAARLWIGNRIRVAPHYDVKENLAICVAGRREFTLMPPEQIANLYPGPFEQTPAGTPVSMVDVTNPDLAAYPRFADAWASARRAVLEPGDAIYIPYCWWHAVASLDPVNMLVNYWWNEGGHPGMGGPYDALLHALLALRHLPPDQRAVWRTWFDFYVFEQAGDPAAHLPVQARGVLGPPQAEMFARMKEIVRQSLAEW